MERYTHFKLFVFLYLRIVLKKLERLAGIFNLSHTKLNKKELNYCEYDCKVVYDLINTLNNYKG